MTIINPMLYNKYLAKKIEMQSLSNRTKFIKYMRSAAGGASLFNALVQSNLSFNKKDTK